jgi:hypothetical protein
MFRSKASGGIPNTLLTPCVTSKNDNCESGQMEKIRKPETPETELLSSSSSSWERRLAWPTQHTEKEKIMSYVATKEGLQIYYKDWGSGQPIVFSNGAEHDAHSRESRFYRRSPATT